jgi:hypothetical protein
VIEDQNKTLTEVASELFGARQPAGGSGGVCVIVAEGTLMYISMHISTPRHGHARRQLH